MDRVRATRHQNYIGTFVLGSTNDLSKMKPSNFYKFKRLCSKIPFFTKLENFQKFAVKPAKQYTYLAIKFITFF